MTDEHCACCARPPRPGEAGLCALHQRRKLRSEPMTQPHDLVGQAPSGYGLLGIVERDETGVLCHECGRWFGGLSWHITKTHGMSVAEYRSVHQLPAGAPLVSLATSAKISANSREQIGTAAWQRFEARRDETLPGSRQAAVEASVAASAGTKALRARQASERFTGRRRLDDARWMERLAGCVAHQAATGAWPRSAGGDAAESSLGGWLTKQRQGLARDRLTDQRREALLAAGIGPPAWRWSDR